MSSAKVNIKEIDASARAASFPGVYGAMVIPSDKGPTLEPTLVTSDKELLSLFTPKGTVSVGMSTAFFSALAYLEKSNQLWVVRPEAANMLYSAASLKVDGSTYPNFTHSAGLADPLAYTFDSLPDVEGVAQVTRVTTIDSTTLDGKYFILHDAGGSVAVWYDIDNSGTAEPVHGAIRSIEVSTVVTGDTADQVAVKTAAAIAADAGFSATVQSGNQVVVVDASTGARGTPTVGSSGFTVVLEEAGVAEISNVDECVLIYAANQGAWGSDVQIRVEDNSDILADSFKITVYLASSPSTVLETWICSRIESKKDGFGKNIFIESVLEGSAYIRGLNNPDIDETVKPKEQTISLSLGGGANGDAVTDGNMILAADTLKSKDLYTMSVVMDGGYTTVAYQQKLIQLAESRQDTTAILSMPYEKEASASYMSDVIDYRKTELASISSYASIYSSQVLIYDAYNDRKIYISADGFVGGAISGTANSAELWYPVAGFQRGALNVLGVKNAYTEAQRDQLQAAQINPIRFTAGRGISIWGQKTLQVTPSLTDRLNVRLLLNYMKPVLDATLEPFLFELSSDSTLLRMQTLLEDFMDNLQARSGVTEYAVVVEKDSLDPNAVNVGLYFNPTASLEQINLSLVVTSSGTTFSLAGE